MSERKHYFVRNIVKAFARNDYYEHTKVTNPLVDQEFNKILKDYMKTAHNSLLNRDKKTEIEMKTQLKIKAMSRAIQNVKQMEALRIRSKSASDALKQKLNANKEDKGAKKEEETEEKVGN